MHQHRTGLYREIEDKLDEPLEAFVTERRGSGLSWRAIARQLETRTEVVVHDETLRVWFTYRRQVSA